MMRRVASGFSLVPGVLRVPASCVAWSGVRTDTTATSYLTTGGRTFLRGLCEMEKVESRGFQRARRGVELV